MTRYVGVIYKSVFSDDETHSEAFLKSRWHKIVQLGFSITGYDCGEEGLVVEGTSQSLRNLAEWDEANPNVLAWSFDEAR